MYHEKIYKEELKEFSFVCEQQIDFELNLNELIAFKTLIEDFVKYDGRFGMMTYYFEKKGTYLVYFIEKDFSLKYSEDLDVNSYVRFRLLLDVKNFKKIKIMYGIINNCIIKSIDELKDKSNLIVKKIIEDIKNIIYKVKNSVYYPKGIRTKLYIKKSDIYGYYDLNYIKMEIIKNDSSNYNLVKCFFKYYSMFEDNKSNLAHDTYEKISLILLQFVTKTKIYNKLEINDKIYDNDNNYDLKKDLLGKYKDFYSDTSDSSELFNEFYNIKNYFPSDTKDILICFYEKLTLEEQNAFLISCSNFIESLDVKNYSKGILSCFVAIENLATLENMKIGKSETEKKGDAIETFIHKKMDNFLDDTIIKHFSKIRHKYAHRGIANNSLSTIIFRVEDSTEYDYQCIIFVTYIILCFWIKEKNI